MSGAALELHLLTMLEDDMKNGDIDPNDGKWASSFAEKLGRSDALSKFKSKCINLITTYAELRRDGFPHVLAVQDLKSEQLLARVRMNEAKIQQLQEHTRQMSVLSGQPDMDESEFSDSDSDVASVDTDLEYYLENAAKYLSDLGIDEFDGVNEYEELGRLSREKQKEWLRKFLEFKKQHEVEAARGAGAAVGLHL